MVSEEGGPRENMLPGISGLLCSPAHEAWTMATASLLTDDGRRRTMGIAAREYALTRTWDRALAPVVRRLPRGRWRCRGIRRASPLLRRVRAGSPKSDRRQPND